MPSNDVAAPTVDRTSTWLDDLRRGLNNNRAGRITVIGGFVVMLIIFAVMSPSTFLQFSTLRNILDQAVVPIILVSGVTFVLITGEFDLSFPSVAGLCAAVAVVILSHGYDVVIAIGAALVLALGLGLLVGFLVTWGKASSFIVTLAVGSALAGLEAGATGNTTIYTGIPEAYTNLTTTAVFGLRLPVWLALIIVAGAAITLQSTRYGRQAQAVGSNVNAAFLAGVRVKRVRLYAFVILGLLAGISAIILTSRASSYYPNVATGFLLSTYVAAFLGAAVGSGNRFTVIGAAFGVIFITTLQTGLTLTSQPAWLSNVIQGVVLATAVLIAARGARRQA